MLFHTTSLLLSLLTNALPTPDDPAIPINLITDPAPIKLDICSSKDYENCHLNLHLEPNKCYTTYTYLDEKNGSYKVASIALGEGTSCTLFGAIHCQKFGGGYTFEITESMGDLVQDPVRKWPFVEPYQGAGVLSFICRAG